MIDYEQAISQLVSTMQEKLYELQNEKSEQINRRNNLSSRLADVRKKNSDLKNYIQYLQSQISLLTQNSQTLEEEKEKISVQLQSYVEKITSIAEQAKNEKNSWAKESDYLRSKIYHIESQYRVDAAEEEKQLKMKSQELMRLEQELKAVCDELDENQNKVNHKRQLEQSRLRHLEERSRILDSIYKN